jgi:sarcosine oxidase subunit gamma
MSDVLSTEKAQIKPADLVAVMDQYCTLPAHSPVFDSHKHYTIQPTTSQAGIAMKEVGLMGHLILRGDSHNREFVSAVSAVLGLELPTKPLTSSANDVTSILWLGPDEWLIMSGGDMVFDIEVALRAKLTGHFSLVNQSGGQTIIELSGENAIDVLKKSTPLDVHPKHFPVGKAATSVLGKSSALFYHAGEKQWRIVVRRSFADYIWRWLADAGKEFGLAIEK